MRGWVMGRLNHSAPPLETASWLLIYLLNGHLLSPGAVLDAGRMGLLHHLHSAQTHHSTHAKILKDSASKGTYECMHVRAVLTCAHGLCWVHVE